MSPEKSVKNQLDELEKLAITRYTDYYDEQNKDIEEFNYHEKQTLINDYLNNSEIEEYYELLEENKKVDFANK